ncbi:hypothetical protein PPRY_a4316 [Pseudoalteromonas prydzensis ACAM 620]|nr:hypothetical protein [Pseudoalteromonas prydzensis ACAM 620]
MVVVLYYCFTLMHWYFVISLNVGKGKLGETQGRKVIL